MIKTIVVLYHDDADGFGAAYACWVKFKDTVHYIPVQYKQSFPIIPEGVVDLFIVDFSYDRDTLLSLSRKYNLVVLDHHKTAEKELEGLPFAIFNNECSGCVITWDYLHTFLGTPEILLYVQDRDLWKFEMYRSKEVNAYIATLPYDFDVWDNVDIGNALCCGEAIINFQNRQIESRLKDVRIEEVVGYIVPVVNATENISELGNELCRCYPDSPFSVSYCDRANGIRSYSLRSIGEFDVSVVAKQFNGGGHRNAAGFAVKNIRGFVWEKTNSKNLMTE